MKVKRVGIEKVNNGYVLDFYQHDLTSYEPWEYREICPTLEVMLQRLLEFFEPWFDSKRRKYLGRVTIDRKAEAENPDAIEWRP